MHTLVRNPQNNFRVFLNGVVQFDSQSPGLANFASAAGKVLAADTTNPGDVLLSLVLEALQKPMSAADLPVAQNSLSPYSILGSEHFKQSKINFMYIFVAKKVS